LHAAPRLTKSQPCGPVITFAQCGQCGVLIAGEEADKERFADGASFGRMDTKK
jgi:hypothetical protein